MWAAQILDLFVEIRGLFIKAGDSGEALRLLGSMRPGIANGDGAMKGKANWSKGETLW